MPWTPMRVEQRIGRIDRLGQRFPADSIVTLHDENTVETDVYQALRLRIGLFSRFDQHATSVELWSPGIPLFQEPKRSSRMRSRGAL